MKRFFFLLLGLTLAHLGAGQQTELLRTAHRIVDTLCSPAMHGRGYVMKGDSIAAEYFSAEFKRLKLQSFGVNYFQSLVFPVNTFPNQTNITLTYKPDSKSKDRVLVPGRDYLVRCDSPESETDFDLLTFNEDLTASEKKYKKFKNKKHPHTLAIDGCKINNKEQVKKIEKWCLQNTTANCLLIFTNEKLTWDVSQTQGSIPVFEIHCDDSLRINDVERIKTKVNAKIIRSYESQNVIGYIKGTLHPDSFIVFSAHYDHLGMMGKEAYFPGANDNASGCAMLLSLAKYYSEHPPKYSVAFMAFCGEEAGLLGSRHYVENPLFPLKQIKFLVNMDILGTGDEGIKVVNATEHKNEFDELVKINEEKKLLPSVQPRGKAAISDHYFFTEARVKTFFIYTLGGIKAYHDIYDRPETLPLTKFEEAYNLLINFESYLEK